MNDTIHILNKLLKGEHMAIKAVDQVANTIASTEVRNELYDMQTIHKENAMRLSKYIQHLGGVPDDTTGFSGLMSQTMLQAKAMVKRSPEYIIGEIREGELKGIKAAKALVEGQLEGESKRVVEEILARDESNLWYLDELAAKAKQY